MAGAPTISCSIWFVDGESLKFRFPLAATTEFEVLKNVEKGLANRSIAVQLEGRLIIIPLTSIRTIELSPVPKKMPAGVIKNARIV